MDRCLRNTIFHISIVLSAASLFSCSGTRSVSRFANRILLNDSILVKGHTGISIYEPATGKYWYDHDGDKYFIPCSNVKLFTLYTGMKYLGDSLAGLYYQQENDSIYALPSGDPTFLHPGFTNQPVKSFFDSVKLPLVFSSLNWKSGKYGTGWAWDDHNDNYMAERSAFPVHGNIMTSVIGKTEPGEQWQPGSISGNRIRQVNEPPVQNCTFSYEVNNNLKKAIISRNLDENIFNVRLPSDLFPITTSIPFATKGITTALELLHETYPLIQSKEGNFTLNRTTAKVIRTCPADSLFRPMMHNSDNFFAEQTLLMVSDRLLGYMNEKEAIDSILKTDLHGLPQKPKWADGSGLSRYNLFTPQSFVYILEKLLAEFGQERLERILPTGGSGTLKNDFLSEKNMVFAKTGTLGNQSALSGFLITKKGKVLIFSVLANNFPSGAAPVRHSFEKFIKLIITRF